MVAIIAARAANTHAIGYRNRLPWPPIFSDIRRFRELTTGHPVIMGMNTFAGIVEMLGHPLKGRENIVLTLRHTREVEDGGGVAVPSTKAALEVAERGGTEAFVIGGTRVYEEMLPHVNTLHITTVHPYEGTINGDVLFPIVPSLAMGWRIAEHLATRLYDPADSYPTSYTKYMR